MAGLFTENIKTDEAAQQRVRDWVAALRSDKYAQTDGMLRYAHPDGDSFCCLGVACDLYNPEGWSQGVNGFRYEYEGAFLPETVMDAYAIRDSGGDFDRSTRSLIGLNDQGASFAEIADVIEAELNAALKA